MFAFKSHCLEEREVHCAVGSRYKTVGDTGFPRSCPSLSPVCGFVCRLGRNGPLKRIHTSDLVITDSVSLLILVIAQVV
jgi:hypothetical protein